MDLATVIGLIGSFGIVVLAMIMGGSVIMFISPPSLAIVMIGTGMVVLMKFSLAQFIGSIKVALKAFFFKCDRAEDLIHTAVDLADVARKGGLLSLEGKVIENEFLQKGVQLLVDGHEPDVVRSMMQKDMSLTVERHEIGQKLFGCMADVAPAMGMIGTLVGLVQMLSNMDDPKSIGPAMAIALLTTLYGAMIANMFAKPIEDKLNLRCSEEQLTKSLIIDALSGIQNGQNPRVIEEMLKNYLPGSKRLVEIEAEG